MILSQILLAQIPENVQIQIDKWDAEAKAYVKKEQY